MAEEQKPLIELPEGTTVSIEDQVRIRTPRFVRGYANSVAVGFSQWDVHLTFGDILGKQKEEGEEKVVIEETCQIVLTREIAKALTGILAQKLLEYEKQYGEIKLPVTQQESKEQSEPPRVPARRLTRLD
jgi:hypothetical protein